MGKTIQGEYQVEHILDKKVINNKTMYLVKWKGYKETENSWEPVKNLASCKDMISQFNKQRKDGIDKLTKKIYKVVKTKGIIQSKTKISAKKQIDDSERKQKKQSPKKMVEDLDSSEEFKLANLPKRGGELKKLEIKNIPIDLESDEEVSAISEQSSLKCRQKGKEKTLIKEPELKVEDMYKDKWGKFWYNIVFRGKRETISWQKLIELNFMALIRYYESCIQLDE